MSNIQLQLTIFLILIVPSIYALSPLVTYQSPLIETGIILFILGFYDLYQANLVSDVITSTYKFQYNVTLQRLPNTSPSDYKFLMGFYSFDYRIGFDMANINRFTLMKKNKLTTSFTIFTEFSDLSKMNYVKISYIAINNQLCQTYIFYFNQTIYATNFTTVTSHHFPGIADISQPYRTVMTIVQLKSGYSDSSSNTAFLDVWMRNEVSSQYYDVEVISTNLYIQFMTVDILFIDPVWMTATNKAQKFEKLNWMQSSSTYNILLIYSDPTLPIFNKNHFIGLTSFKVVNAMLIYDLQISNNQMWIQMQTSTHIIKGYLIVVAHKYCPLAYGYDKNADTCIECKLDCLRCQPTICLECTHNFTVAVDMVSCTCPYPVLSHTCFDYDNSPMKGCENAVYDPFTFYVSCNFCSLSQKLTLVNGDCVCQSGYENNNATNNCTEICGDGRLFESQCDDGNVIDGDGCSLTCKVQDNFKCDNTQQPSFCTSLFQLKFSIDSVMKNQDNSAVIKLSSKFKNLPYPLLEEQFINNSSGEPVIFTLKVTNPLTGEIQDIPLTLISVKNNKFELRFDIPFKIESFQAQLTIHPYKTRYLPQKDIHTFELKGTNQPLKYTNNMSLLKSGSMGAMIEGIILIILLGVGLLAPKYIALQGVITLQLIFFSQLLIYDNRQWPLVFNIFKNFLYINGYNIGVIEMTDYYLNSNINKKYYNLMIQKTFVENFNTSGIVLIICFVGYFVAMMVYRRKEQLYFYSKSTLVNEITSIGMSEITTQYNFWHKISNFSHNVLSQISMWCILQILCGISANIQISNSSVTIINLQLSKSLLPFQGTFLLLSFTIIFILGLNYFKNLLMSTTTMGKWRQRWQEWLYKRIVFVYLIVIGCVVFFLNDIEMALPASVIALVIHLLYMLVVFKIDPYKLSLRIHTVSLWLCQFLYLMFLVFINIINLLDTYLSQTQIPQLITLIICYFILICAFAIIILSFIRLYYQYRYGEQLQKQILQQRQQQQKRKKLQQQSLLNKKIQLLQNQKLNSLDQKQQSLIKNQYLYDNISKQQAMIELLAWLETRTNWTKQQKEKYYYQRFHTKPLKYLKNNNQKQYNKMINEHNSYRNKEIQKSRKLKQDLQLNQIKQRIKSYKINNENSKLKKISDNKNKSIMMRVKIVEENGIQQLVSLAKYGKV